MRTSASSYEQSNCVLGHPSAYCALGLGGPGPVDNSPRWRAASIEPWLTVWHVSSDQLQQLPLRPHRVLQTHPWVTPQCLQDRMLPSLHTLLNFLPSSPLSWPGSWLPSLLSPPARHRVLILQYQPLNTCGTLRFNHSPQPPEGNYFFSIPVLFLGLEPLPLTATFSSLSPIIPSR